MTRERDDVRRQTIAECVALVEGMKIPIPAQEPRESQGDYHARINDRVVRNLWRAEIAARLAAMEGA